MVFIELYFKYSCGVPDPMLCRSKWLSQLFLWHSIASLCHISNVHYFSHSHPGRNAEAEDYYKRAVRLRPQEATAHMNLGAILHFNNKWHEAEKSYLKALKLKPNDPVTEANLQKLRNLINGVKEST